MLHTAYLVTTYVKYTRYSQTRQKQIVFVNENEALEYLDTIGLVVNEVGDYVERSVSSKALFPTQVATLAKIEMYKETTINNLKEDK